MAQNLPFSVVVIGSCFWAISLTCIIFVLFAYFCYKRTKQNLFYYIIFQLGIIDLCFLFSALPLMIEWLKGKVPEDDWMCTASGTLRLFATLCSYYVNALFAWAIYCCVQMNSSRDVLKARYTKMIIIIYLFTSILSILPNFTNSIGMGALYCGMVLNDETGWKVVWAITIYYVPSSFSILSISYFIIRSISKLRSYFPGGKRKSCKFYNLLVIPGIFLFINAGSMLDRLFVVLFGEAPMWIVVAHFLTRQLQGFLHGGLYTIMILGESSAKRSSSSLSDSAPSKNELSDTASFASRTTSTVLPK